MVQCWRNWVVWKVMCHNIWRGSRLRRRENIRLSITATKKRWKRKDELTRNWKSQRLEHTQRQIEKYTFSMQTTYQTKEEVCFLSQNFNNSDNKNLFGRQFTRLLLSFHTQNKYSSINLRGQKLSWKMNMHFFSCNCNSYMLRNMQHST